MENIKNNESIPPTAEIAKIRDLAEESSLMGRDEMQRQILRGDETKGDPDDRDVAGAVRSDETPHGNENAKTIQKEVANKNG